MDAETCLLPDTGKIDDSSPYYLECSLLMEASKTNAIATVTDKGQLTVPLAIREQLGIKPGTKLDFELMPDGSLRVRVLSRGAANLFGLLHRPGAKAHTIEEMDEGIAKAVTARNKRSKS